MPHANRKIAFVLASSDHGTMIVNRMDYRMNEPGRGIGVGFQILNKSSFDPQEIALAVQLLQLRRQHFGNGVIAIDCGANIGVHTIEWAKAMTGWGSVLAIEAQERVYYALTGNIAINNCFNARALNAAVGAANEVMKIPSPNYQEAGSFGSLELRQTEKTEFIGQTVDYSESGLVDVKSMTIDSLNLARVDFIKIDVEGMELETLEGAQASVAKSHPILFIETIKSERADLRAWLSRQGYEIHAMGINLMAVHESDPGRAQIKVNAPKPAHAK